MIVNDLSSFLVGVLFGVVGSGISLGFAVALITFAGADSDAYKRGLSGRHSARELRGGSLPGVPFTTTPVVAPQKDSTGPGSFTAAGRAKRPPRHNFSLSPPVKPARSRPESPGNGH
jgi:hypothetical protein